MRFGFRHALGLTEIRRGLVPGDLGALLLGYWDAEAGVTSAGSRVSAWLDRVAGRSLSQAVGTAQPTFSPTGVNGRVAVIEDGIATFLTLDSQPFPAGSEGSEIWWAGEQITRGALSGRIFSYGGSTNPTARYLGRSTTGAAIAAVGNGSGVSSASGVGEFFGRALLRARFEPPINGVAQSTTLFINGQAVAQTTATPATGTTRVRSAVPTTNAVTSFNATATVAYLVTGLLSQGQAGGLTKFLRDRIGGWQ